MCIIHLCTINKPVNFFEQGKERLFVRSCIFLWKHQSRRDVTCCPISIAICPYCSPARWRACHSEALREELEGLNPPMNVCIPLMNVPTFPPRSFTAPCRWTCVRKQVFLYPVLPFSYTTYLKYVIVYTKLSKVGFLIKVGGFCTVSRNAGDKFQLSFVLLGKGVYDLVKCCTFLGRIKL